MSTVTHMQCDACHVKYELSRTSHESFARLTDVNGQQHDICSACVKRLFEAS